ncbi:stalk domain-containing protein [Chengkuizengella axinellae]|uniref:Stalk domain-containing protein n=1 Tax=Chengkuizengella axinellae TaxID=3064388 RepID=A0ABT9ITP4_9BACL|nr:stalk domain-containing protein [Chengkuizengella sp. 2205SS18-9]MDP5272719.1 stalk domain-containing protein [Chengkuizengella sp. 2205SS18-9]
MKKTLILLCFIMLSGLFSSVAYGEEESKIQVWIDGEQIQFDQEPFSENGTTLVPFRVLFSELGLNVLWDQETKTVTGINDNIKVELTLDSNEAIVNGETIQLLVAPQLVNNSTFVPLRFVGESTGASVRWDGTTKTIFITSPEPKVNDEELILEFFDQYEEFYDDEDMEILSLFEEQYIEEWYIDEEIEMNFEIFNDDFEIIDFEILNIDDNEAIVFTAETFERKDGSFYLDQMYEQVYTLMKHKDDKWLINDIEITSFEYFNLEELKDSDVEISNKDEDQILATFDKYLDAFKEESFSKLKTTFHEDYLEMLDAEFIESYYKELLFAYYDYTYTKVEEAKAVYVYEDEITFYIEYTTKSTYEETGEVEIESYEEVVTFKKSKSGKWKIVSFETVDYNIEYE